MDEPDKPAAPRGRKFPELTPAQRASHGGIAADKEAFSMDAAERARSSLASHVHPRPAVRDGLRALTAGGLRLAAIDVRPIRIQGPDGHGAFPRPFEPPPATAPAM